MPHRRTLYLIFAYFALSLLIVSLALASLDKGAHIRQELNRDPGESYNTDMHGFLKTYYLMKAGTNFYQAFPVAMRGAFRSDFNVDLTGWREPLIFYLWTLLPGRGESIYFLAFIMFSLDLICAYLIARRFLSSMLSLLSPLFLLPYFYLPLTDLTILQPEWWALNFLFIGLVFYFHDRALPAGIFFALTLATREMFFAPILALVALKPSTRIIFPISFFLAYYILHFINLLPYQTSVLWTLRPGNWRFLHKIFAYSSWNYPLGVYRPFVIAFLVTTGVLLYQVLRRRSRPAVLLLSTYLPTFIALLAVNLAGRMTQWHDYWGIYFVPLLIVVTPIALATLWTTRSQE